MGTWWTEFREVGRSDSEAAQDFSAVLTDFSSLMLKIKLYIWGYELGWETYRLVISLSTIKGLEEIFGFDGFSTSGAAGTANCHCLDVQAGHRG